MLGEDDYGESEEIKGRLVPTLVEIIVPVSFQEKINERSEIKLIQNDPRHQECQGTVESQVSYSVAVHNLRRKRI